MNERETKSFVTPGNHTVVLRTYLTGKEAAALKAIMFADLKINASDAVTGKVGIADLPATFLVSQENKVLEYLVVSVDGETANAIEKLGDLPEADYNAVLAEVQKIRVPLVPKS
jgi:hypothetical protein